jgi:geranylgeranyl diphosphate synthase, type II
MECCMLEKEKLDKLNIQKFFEGYKNEIEKALNKNFSCFGKPSNLRDACEYAVMNGGKRLRPMITLMVAKGLGKQKHVMWAALASEYLHTASLIADDLPCMDDDDLRRSKPSTHKVYGEDVALLASYALIAEGYQCLSKNVKHLKQQKIDSDAHSDNAGILSLENMTHNTGILGATGGQFLDMYPEEKTISFLQEVVKKKTVALFEISFVLGWLFAGGDSSRLNLIKDAAQYFGEAFQIADDFEDMEQDKRNNSQANFVLVLGKEAAWEKFSKDLESFEDILSKLGEGFVSEEFKLLSKYLKATTFKYLG